MSKTQTVRDEQVILQSSFAFPNNSIELHNQNNLLSDRAFNAIKSLIEKKVLSYSISKDNVETIKIIHQNVDFGEIMKMEDSFAIIKTKGDSPFIPLI